MSVTPEAAGTGAKTHLSLRETLAVYCKRRVLKLQQHFGQANEDVRQILISAEKVEKRGARISEVEFDQDDAAAAPPAPIQRKLQAGE